ncbi:pentapeptide repeat-containing protein [Leptothoe kymatousa]|uniref:Pentapeptide repeat-containing protein n=1 Tax=Leptothoe kymatousa TAU-MAC 1615 TaxID=2364775 RepID=A0ABS5Y1F7_9CYAN|nr:pentapeptide repeat-containing protein [Leptothoe kymatousa]MBT9311667.1 pentapeptide repeat-containing protein [Leptothoe kymatousa TAU-MAC 1615]
MANTEHVELLKQGVEVWNHWRKSRSDVVPDLANADLSGMSLAGINLSEADLQHADLSYAELPGANLQRASLGGVNLQEAFLFAANLGGASLWGARLVGLNLSDINLSGADLRKADLAETDLQRADLSEADLRGANLSRAQALGTNFYRAVFTTACLEDWNINSATVLDDVVCSYVYLKTSQEERRPREGVFKPGEFSALFQQALDTVDLIFKDGIDWQAFFQSFQDLRTQYTDQDLSIQAIEKKRDGAFVVRLEVTKDADKTAIEGSAKELYETKLALMEQRYRDVLQAKEGEIIAYREQSTNLMEIIKLQSVRPPMTEIPKYDLRGAQFAGGFAETVQGDQGGGTINNYGPNTEDITRLLTDLRDQAQTFPTTQKNDANDVLHNLERDLKEDQPNQGRISRNLKKLVILGTAIGTITSGAATTSGDLSTFTTNVIELTQKLGIPIEQVQLRPSATP